MMALYKLFQLIDVSTKPTNYPLKEEPDMLKMLISMKSKHWLVL